MLNQDFNKDLTPQKTHPVENKSRRAVTIGRDREEVYRFWRDFRNLSRFMKDVVDVRPISDTRSHWIVQVQKGPRVEWDAELVADEPGHMIAWRSLPDSIVKTSGSVWFSRAEGERGTVVSLTMDYEVPGGKLTEFITMFTGEDPDSLALINLHRLKGYLETGEIATTEGQPSGREEIPSITH